MPTFDYTSRDYDSIRNDLVKRAAITIPEWNGTDASEFANMFVDLWAYMGDVLHYYIDRAASETFISTATQRESVLAIANLMDYVPASPRAARGHVTVSLQSVPTEYNKTATISTATVSGSNVTFVTSASNSVVVGQAVTISGVTNTAFNITNAVVASVTNNTTFVIATSSYSSAPTGSSTGGTVTYDNAYVIPAGSTFTGYDADNNAHLFYNPADSPGMMLNATSSYPAMVPIPIVQGMVISQESLGDSYGLANQSVTLLKSGVDIDSIEIFVAEGAVDGSGNPTLVQYQYVAQLSDANYTDRVFTARYNSGGYTQILFGNGFNGYIPTNGAAITANYRVTDGSAGNTPSNHIKYINGSLSSYIKVESSTYTYGGADQESLQSIKTNVSKLYRTQDRAVSLQDYKDLTLQVAGVSKATAVYADPVVTIYPVPHQASYPTVPRSSSGTTKVIIEIPQSMAENIESYFSTRSMLGVSAVVTDPSNFDGADKYIECTPVWVGMDLYVKPTYVQSWVKNEVDKAVKALLDFDKTSFGQILTVGEVYRAILAVDGVDYVNLTKLSTTYGATSAANVTAASTKLLCFTDGISGQLAVNITAYNGLTGSN